MLIAHHYVVLFLETILHEAGRPKRCFQGGPALPLLFTVADDDGRWPIACCIPFDDDMQGSG